MDSFDAIKDAWTGWSVQSHKTSKKLTKCWVDCNDILDGHAELGEIENVKNPRKQT